MKGTCFPAARCLPVVDEKTIVDSALYESRHSFVWNLRRISCRCCAPQPGERILDIGCGTGQLTAKIAESGAARRRPGSVRPT